VVLASEYLELNWEKLLLVCPVDLHVVELEAVQFQVINKTALHPERKEETELVLQACHLDFETLQQC